MKDTDDLQLTTKTAKSHQLSVGVPLEIFPYRFPESGVCLEVTSPRTRGLPQVPSPRLSDAHLSYLLKLPQSNLTVTPHSIHNSPASLPSALSVHLTSPFQPYDKRLSRSLTASATQVPLFDHQREPETSLSFFTPNTSSGIMEPLRAQLQQTDFSSSLGANVHSRLSTSSSRPPHSIVMAPTVETEGYVPPLPMKQDYDMDSPFLISTSQRLVSGKSHQRSPDNQPHSRRATRSKDKQKLRMTSDILAHMGSSSGSLDLSKDAEMSVTGLKRRRSLSFGNTDESDQRRGKLLSIYGAGSESSSVPAHIKNSEMYRIYNSWALKNYGDSGKTKTVTRNKYRRIVGILVGDDPSASDNAKFKFWVKAKGFCLSPMKVACGERILLVPSKHEVRKCAVCCHKKY